MLFTEVILKNLLRRKTRSVLTVAGLSAAVAATTVLLSIAWSYAAATSDYYAARHVDIVVVRAGVAERITSSLSQSLEARLSALPEVARVDGSLTEMVSLGARALFGVPLHGLQPGGFAIGKLTVGPGRVLETGDHHAILLGSALARAFDKAPGQSIAVDGTDFRVAGIFQSDNVLESNTAVAPLSDVQDLMGRPGQVSEFQLQVVPTVAGDASIRRLCRQIESLRDDQGHSLGFKSLPTAKFVDSDTETRLASAMAWGTSIIAVALSVVGMLNTMLMSVLERTKELGILRAVGWTRTRVIRLILGECLVIATLSALLGASVAELLVRGLAAWSFTRNFVHPNLSPAALAFGIALTLSAGLAGSFYPAYRAATIAPTEALRFE